MTFSILERIDVGETNASLDSTITWEEPFSILERIDVGETLPAPEYAPAT